MKQLAITGNNRIEIIEYEDRPLGPHEVLVRTEIASGKHGTASAILDGSNSVGVRFDQEMRLFVDDPGAKGSFPTREHPWNLGTSGVGVIEQVGSEVSRWKIGDRVFGLMGIKETNIVHEEGLWELGSLDPLSALAMEPAYVAFHSVRESQLRFGDKVAVIGLGAIGLAAVKMAKSAGAEQIIAIDLIERRRQLALELGADVVIDPSVGDAALMVHQLTGGPGVDVAIEVAGAYPALDLAIRSTRITGTVCATGFYQGESRGIWLGREWHHNRLNMVVPHGCGWGHPPRDYPRWTQHRAYDAIVSMMRKGSLDLSRLITPILTLEESAGIFDTIKNRPEEVIKFAVRF